MTSIAEAKRLCDPVKQIQKTVLLRHFSLQITDYMRNDDIGVELQECVKCAFLCTQRKSIGW